MDKEVFNYLTKEEKLRVIKITKLIKSWNLNYTFRSIDYCVNKNDTSLSQLRAGVFLKKDESDTIENVEKAVKMLLVMGLITKNNKDEYKKAECLAFRYMEQWRKYIGSLDILHIVLIRYMEEEHFFMGDQEVADLMTLRKISQDDLVMIKIAKNMKAMNVVLESEKLKKRYTKPKEDTQS